jgi:hypothetical protein
MAGRPAAEAPGVAAGVAADVGDAGVALGWVAEPHPKAEARARNEQ